MVQNQSWFSFMGILKRISCGDISSPSFHPTSLSSFPTSALPPLHPSPVTPPDPRLRPLRPPFRTPRQTQHRTLPPHNPLLTSTLFHHSYSHNPHRPRPRRPNLPPSRGRRPHSHKLHHPRHNPPRHSAHTNPMAILQQLFSLHGILPLVLPRKCRDRYSHDPRTRWGCLGAYVSRSLDGQIVFWTSEISRE